MMKKEMVLASAVMAFLMVFSAMAVPAAVDKRAPAAESVAEAAQVAEAYPETVVDTHTFTMVGHYEPEYLDPAVDYGMLDVGGTEVIQNVYETLVWYDRDSVQNLVPLLATEVPTIGNGGVSEDGMNYTFDLRADVTFHDGTDLTAEDVAYSVQRVLRIHDPNGPSWMLEQVMTCYLSFYIGETVETWVDWEAPPQWLLDGAGLTNPSHVLTENDNQAVAEFMITEVDVDTVNFRLTKPYPAFIQICACTLMSVVSKDYVEANGGVVNGQHNSHMDENVCGTGPYTMLPGDWVFGTEIHLTRNADYWGPAPSLDDVYLLYIYDEATRISMLENGTADSISMSIFNEEQFVYNPDIDITKGLPSFDMTFAGFNMNIDDVGAASYGSDVPADFFADKYVRSAFVEMLDYNTFIMNLLMGNAIQPNGPIPRGMFGYDESIPAYSYDMEAAKACLQTAVNPDTGHSWWEDGFSIALFYNAGNEYRESFCVYMRTALENLTDMAAGDTDAVFAATINTLDWPTYLAMLRATPSPFPLFYLGWAPDYADPDDYVSPLLHGVYGTFTHYTGYNNETLNDMIFDAAAELDEGVRENMYYDISMLVYEDAPYLWLWQLNSFHIERSWVNGYYHNAMYGGLYYAALSKDDGLVVIEADIVVAPTPGVVGSTMTFDGSGSYSSAGSIVSYVWDFGDGSLNETGVTVEHVYTSGNIYDVTLTVTDDLDNTDAAIQQVLVIDVTEDDPPVADAGDDQPDVVVGDTVTFDGSGSSDDVGITNYTWTFTYDGAVREVWGLAPEFEFDIAGIYVVTLTVTDGEAQTDTDTVTITVSEPSPPPENVAPVADAGPDQTVTQGATVTFDGTGSTDTDGTIASYNWTFEYDGEEQTLTGAEPTFEFNEPGEYVVTLTVTDSDGDTDTDTVTITVEADDSKSFIEAYGLFIAAIAAIVVVAAVAMILMKRRKGGKGPSSEAAEGTDSGEP